MSILPSFRLRNVLLAALLMVLASVAAGCGAQRNLSPNADRGISPSSASRPSEDEMKH
jgi:hypothetical protein